MGMKRRFPIASHAMTMVGRSIRSYGLLSVTIIMSFSLLLSYLLYMDSSLYNRYKELFSLRRGDVVVEDRSFRQEKKELFLEKLNGIPGTDCYTAWYANLGHSTQQYDGEAIGMGPGETFHLTNLDAFFFPDYAWMDGFSLMEDLIGFSMDIVWLGAERKPFTLAADEVILSQQVYLALGMDKVDAPIYQLRTEQGPPVELKVVGYCPGNQLDFSEDGWKNMAGMILSTKFIDTEGLLDPQIWEPHTGTGHILYSRYFVIHSQCPEEVVSIAEQMNFPFCRSVCELQNNALEEIRTVKGNKALIACAMLLLLGINLYSSFTNALNERKFEIGVKRAIGASPWSIVKQFLCEGIIVMALNTAVSIVLVIDGAILFKVIYERTPDFYGMYRSFTVLISPYSAAMFGLCAVTLTVVFSLIFAWKTTRVEIIQYLKAE